MKFLCVILVLYFAFIFISMVQLSLSVHWLVLEYFFVYVLLKRGKIGELGRERIS